MRLLFAPVVASSILLAPFAYGNTLQPGPRGSTPSDKSFILTFDSSADLRSSYIVDHKGFYEHGSWPRTSSIPIGAFGASDGTGDKGSSLTTVSTDAFNSKGGNGGAGASFAGIGGLFSSNGGAVGSAGMSLGRGPPSFDFKGLDFKGLGKGSGFHDGGKGLLNSGPADFDPDPRGERPRDLGGSVSATPLPASWTMMLIGLLAFGLLACFRKLKRSAARPQTVAFAAE